MKNQCQENVAQDLLGCVEQVMLRDDVEDGRAGDRSLMIEAHAVQNACAAVVARGIEALMAERRHHLDLVLRHGAE